jgi:hypothetical protein
MNRYLFPLYRIIVPKPIRTRILKKNLRKKILSFYFALPPDRVNEEQREVLQYLENNPVTIFPYPFSNNYLPEKIEVLFDPSDGMPYVFMEGKKLYFRKRWTALARKRTITKVRRAWSDLSREQDPQSPHRYLTHDFKAGPEDVIADIGAAEGNFSLSVIEKVRKIYLIEYNPEWVRALEKTFEPWKEKVEIISKYISDRDDDDHITLDTLIKEKKDINFLKIDVDGNEHNLFEGAREVLHSGSGLKIALCTYHKNDDEIELTSLLEKNGFNVNPSKGYMIHYYDKKIKAPYLRRGLIRAVREAKK